MGKDMDIDSLRVWISMKQAEWLGTKTHLSPRPLSYRRRGEGWMETIARMGGFPVSGRLRTDNPYCTARMTKKQ